MSRFDQIEQNIANIVATSREIKPEAIFIRREMMHGNRNMGVAPIVEIELEVVNREHFCDIDDIIRCIVSLTISDRISNDELDRKRLNRAMASIVSALYSESMNKPVDVGVVSDWTIETSRERVEEVETITLRIYLSMIVGKNEVI